MTIVDSSVGMGRLPTVMETRLQEVRRRESSLRLMTGLLDALALFLAALFVALVLDWTFTLFSTSVRSALTNAALIVGAIGLVLLAAVPQLKRRTLPDVAAEVDRSIPDLEERWQTVAKLRTSQDPEAISGSPVFIDRVVAESVAREHLVDPQTVVSGTRLRKHQWLLAAAIGANLLLFVIDAPAAWTLLRRFCSPSAPISLTQVAAASGDFAAARGEPIRLEAAVTRRPPEKASLFLRNSDGEIRTVALAPSTDDRSRFAYSIEAAAEPFSYRFRAGDGQTAWHNVAVYERPKLTNVEFRIESPAYTRLPAVVKSELPTNIRAVEGSQLEIAFSVDQPLEQFHLDLGKDARLPLSPQGSDPLRYVFHTKLEKTIRLSPVFVSQHGLSNLRPPSCQIFVYPDRPPEVSIVSPEREISVRPDDEVVVEIKARDDFGVVRAELVAFVGDQPDMQNAQVIAPPSEKQATAKDAAAAKADAEQAAKTALDQFSKMASDKDAKAGPPSSAATAKAADAKNDTSTSKTDPSVPNRLATTPLKDAKPDATTADPAPASKTADASKRTEGASEAGQNGQAQAAAPKTIRMPIPLNAQAGQKNVNAKVKLDLRQFQLKNGQEVKYMVRVFDSRDGSSKGQTYAEASKPGSTPQTAGSPTSKPTAGAGRGATGKPNGQDAKASAQMAMASSQSSANSAGERPADAARIDASAANGSQQSAGGDRQSSAAKSQPSDRKSQPSQNSASAQANASAAQQGSPQNNKQQGDDKPQGEMSGAPRPPDSMTRRSLDVESQSSASSTMRIHIDQWAGTFDGQQRQKLELLIDPVLKELDAILAKAIDELRPVSVDLNLGKTPGENYKKSLRAADTLIARAQTLVGDLVQKSDGTPYAFVGLQLVDITELHISPARADVKAAKPDAADKQQHIHQAVVHLTRARTMLADLTRTYQNVKRDLKLAEDLQRIRKMYQAFVEDSMAFLGSQRGTLNPKNRKMFEFELDEEFLKKYTELQKQWEKTLADLAKVLAKDPRLLARYMSLSRRGADSLRDQLTILHNRQEELLPPVEQLAGAPPAAPSPAKNKDAPAKDATKTAKADKEKLPPGAEPVRASLRRDLVEIMNGTIAAQEDLGTWLPMKLKPEDPRIAPLREQAARVSTAAALATTAANGPAGPSAAVKQVDELHKQLKHFEFALVPLSETDDPQLVLHVNRRLARVRKLVQLTDVWVEKNTHAQEGRYHRALELDQHRLSEDTLELSGKLENLGAQLAGLPDDILTLGDELKDAVRFDVLVDQMAAELGLRDRNLPSAIEHQKKALDGFTRAEEKFNKLIDRVIQEQDKVPLDVPDIDNMQLQSLEDLLALLENENDLAEQLGIPNRPTNLQGLRDWLNRGGSGNGMGRGMRATGQMRAQMAERARQEALRAAQKAGKTDKTTVRGTASHWNTLGSRLEDTVRQSRGNTPPKQYRRAIERYFESISGAKSSAEPIPPTVPEKQETVPAGGDKTKAK